jgi:hypothetical protein
MQRRGETSFVFKKQNTKMSQARNNERVIIYFNRNGFRSISLYKFGFFFSARECTGEMVVSGVGHLLEVSGTSERAYSSVRYVAKTMHWFHFVLQPSMTVVKVTRSYATPWKFHDQ